MHPFLHTLFGFNIPMYGVMTALGYGAAFYYCYKNKETVGLTSDKLFDLVFYLILGALIGGKLFFIWFNYSAFAAASLIEKIRFGFVFFGGFVGAVVAGYIWLKKHKRPILPVADFLAPAIALGHSIGRIGCFLAGCCYGKETHGLLGVKFTDAASLVPEHLHNTPLYPVQIIEAFFTFILFLILAFFYRRPHKKGFIFAGYLIGYGIIRFSMEFMRADDRGAFIFGLSPSQIISLLLIICAGVLFVVGENDK